MTHDKPGPLRRRCRIGGALYQASEQGSDIPAIVSSENPPVDARDAIESAAVTARRRLEATGLVTVEAVGRLPQGVRGRHVRSQETIERVWLVGVTSWVTW